VRVDGTHVTVKLAKRAAFGQFMLLPVHIRRIYEPFRPSSP
jgi:hypothetical protein